MALRPRARRLWATLRAERRTLRQGLAALVLSTLAGFVAGLILAHLTDRLDRLPGLLVLVPAAVGMRGTIFGAIGARLGTASAAGVFRPTLARDGILYRNVEVAVLTTLSSSLWLAVLAKAASAVVGHPSISIWSLATISVLGGALGSAAILLVTVGLSALSFRRGWDLDSVSTPMVTALGDVATIPTLFLASLLVEWPVANAVAAAGCVVLALAAIARSFTSDVPGVRRIALEMTPVILMTPILDVAAGGLLQAHETRLLALPAVLSVVPPFVSQAGALGGIFSSRTASKLQLGMIHPRAWPDPPVLIDATIVAALGLTVFVLIGVVSLALADLTDLAHPGPGRMIGGTVLAGALTLPITLVVSYTVAVLTARFGLDPDNAAVPIITSVMDLSGIAAFLVAMTLVGVIGA
jgi:mgtE-like transporter